MPAAAVPQIAVPMPMVSPGSQLAVGLAGGACVLLVVLVLLVIVLIGRYRSECHQLRARNNQLSRENDCWHEDFVAQAGELSALRRSLVASCGYRTRSHVKAS